MFPSRDWLLRSHAQDLADQIQDYWAARGKKVRMRLEEYGTNGKSGSVWAVRSDMIAGSPRP
jgi:hypothetical protein